MQTRNSNYIFVYYKASAASTWNWTVNANSKAKASMETVAILMGMLITFSICGAIGNIIVLCAYFKNSKRLTSVFFIKTLATGDLLVCLVTIPLTVFAEYVRHVLQYDVLCKFYMFSLLSPIVFMSFIMVAIACDRYVKLCHPSSRIFTLYRAKIIVVFLTLLALTHGVIMSLFYGVEVQVSSPKLSDGSENGHNLDAVDGALLSFVDYLNMSSVSIPDLDIHPETFEWDNTGSCHINENIFSLEFFLTYNDIHITIFAISAVLVIVIYGVVFVAFTLSRRNTNRLNVATSEGVSQTEHAIIALSLAIVSAIFILFVLPSFLISYAVVPFNAFVFYMYFIYNVLNPVVYSFVSADFRERVKRVMSCKRNDM